MLVESGVIDLKNLITVIAVSLVMLQMQQTLHSESFSNTLTLPSTTGDVDSRQTSTATLQTKVLTTDTITGIVNADIKWRWIADNFSYYIYSRNCNSHNIER